MGIEKTSQGQWARSSQVKSRSQSGKVISESPNVLHSSTGECIFKKRFHVLNDKNIHSKDIQKDTKGVGSIWKCCCIVLLQLVTQVFRVSEIFLDAKVSTSKFKVPNIRQVLKSSSPTPVTFQISLASNPMEFSSTRLAMQFGSSMGRLRADCG